MSAYDLEEQEQLAALKAFWKEWGGRILIVVAAAMIGSGGYFAWERYRESRAFTAGTVYAGLQKAAAARDAAKVRAEAQKLADEYPRTLYAALGALVSAKVHFEAGDRKTARNELMWVIERAQDPEVRAIARLRLANVLLDEKAYDDALKVLADNPPAQFAPLFEELRGDILVAQGKHGDARAAYKTALEKLRPEFDSARTLVQMKLDGIAGIE